MKQGFASILGLTSVLLTGCVGDTATVVPTLDASQPDTSVVNKDASSDADAATTPDTSTVDSGPDAGPSVKDVPGLVLWLDATVGVTANGANQVSKWVDQSGNGNDAAQSIANVQPTLIAQGIGGKPAIRFTTNPNASPFPRLNIADSATLKLGTGDFYISAVVQWENKSSGSLGMIVSKQSTVNPFPGYALYMNFPTSGHAGGQLDANTNVGSNLASLNDGLPRQYGLLRTNGNASIRVNGTPDGTLQGTNVNSDAAQVPLSIGGLEAANGLHPLVGSISEIVIVKGTISVPNINLIEGYLKAKYGL
jgi:hypothetical protein